MTSKSKKSPTGAGTTASGPSHPGSPRTAMAQHAAEEALLAAAMPFNQNKRGEYGYEHAVAPREGTSSEMPSPQTGASTISEGNDSTKTGAPALRPGALDGALTAKRVNDVGQMLTTNQGVPGRRN